MSPLRAGAFSASLKKGPAQEEGGTVEGKAEGAAFGLAGWP